MDQRWPDGLDTGAMRLGAVVCVYRSAFIEQQLASMVAQDPPLDEIVVVDDSGSSDWAEHIERGLRGFRGHADVVRNATNKGLRRSYELAFSRSTADIVFMADHDDEWLPGKTSAVLEVLRDERVAGCYHNLDVYESSAPSVAHGTYLGPFFRFYPGRDEHSADHSFGALLDAPLASGSALAFRRSVIPDDMRIPETVYPDQFVQLLIARSGPFARIEQVLGNYRRHDANISALPSRLDRFRRVTPDPTPLVDALCGYSDDVDRTLARYLVHRSWRRSVERGEFYARIRSRTRAQGFRSTSTELLTVYRRPWKLGGDLVRRSLSKRASPARS